VVSESGSPLRPRGAGPGRRASTKLGGISLHQPHRSPGREPAADVPWRWPSDIRVVLVAKLADRLHNMRTLGRRFKPEKQQADSPAETRENLCPLATGLGIGVRLKWNSKNLAFRCWQPSLPGDPRKEVPQQAQATGKNRAGRSRVRLLKDRLTAAGVRPLARVSGRPKHLILAFWSKDAAPAEGLPRDLRRAPALRIPPPKTWKAAYRALAVCCNDTFRPTPAASRTYIGLAQRNGLQFAAHPP